MSWTCTPAVDRRTLAAIAHGVNRSRRIARRLGETGDARWLGTADGLGIALRVMLDSLRWYREVDGDTLTSSS